ncbi:EF-hand domain-containing protein [Mycena indigotica]|uniref:EF-hand domain-containing protein n=1 Tax=Mycena indigotica TaxID=2126181 RepID=A0A8H6SLZ4_9AGAR|nr:EF-hand domain-containing protein [Mycena indigotica]KAF7301275.1 EF-hand domain-containing protein [Mycena indigotica]
MPPRRPPGLLDIGPSNHQRFQSEAQQHATGSASQDGQLAVVVSAPLQSTDDLPLLSPPYKSHASRTNLLSGRDRTPSPSPSYRTSYMPSPSGDSTDEKGKAKATVHYPDDIAVPPQIHDPEDHHSLLSSAAGTDDEDDDDYNWSDEEDLVDEEAKFENKIGTKKKTGWGPKRIITLLFSSLLGSTFLAGVLVAPALILHFYWYRPHKDAFRHKVTVNVEAWLFWAAANLLISWYLAFIIDVVPTFIRFLISVSWGHVSETIKSRIEMYNAVKNTFKPVFYAASCWVSWVIIFDHIFHMVGEGSANHQRYTSTVHRVIEFFFFLTLVLCAQRLLSHLIAFAFHRTAFKDRIEAVAETLAVVEKLRDYRPKSKRSSGLRTPLFGLGTPTLEKDHFSFLSSKLKYHKKHPEHRDWQGDEGKHHGKHAETPVSEDSPHQYPPSRDHRDRDATLVGTAAKMVKDAVLHDARNIKGEDAAGNLEWNVSSSSEAKRLARSIYMRLKSPTRHYLLPIDFRPPFADQEAADAAFRVFDKDNNGDLSRAEIKTTLVKVYKERRFLARSMRDVNAALKTLDYILIFFALGVQFFISLSVFGVNITSSLTSVYSLIVAASFIFKSAASSAFDSIMFLFVTHPFDTGDRCFIDDEVMVVKKMELFAACLSFLRHLLVGTGLSPIISTVNYATNSCLSINVRRSGKMYENLTMQVAWRTPLEKLDALEAAINKWLSTEENRWFVPSTGITFQRIEFQRYLEFTMAIGHNGTWQDWSLRSARKTAFHAAVQYYCRELGIECYNSPQPIIWTDATAGLPPYNSPNPSGVDLSPEGGSNDDRVIAPIRRTMATSLGFTPHAESTLLRARTHGRKAAMRAAGGGDM